MMDSTTCGTYRTFDPNNPLPLCNWPGGSFRPILTSAHTLRPWDRHGYLRDAAAPSSSRSLNQLSARTPGAGDAAVDVVNLGLQAGALGLRLRAMTSASSSCKDGRRDRRRRPGTFGFLEPRRADAVRNGIEFTVTPQPAGRADRLFRSSPRDHELHGALAAFSAASLTSHTDFRGGGNDFIIGRSGDDLVLAGAEMIRRCSSGTDILFGGLGDDVADGGPGSDLIAGGAGNDRLSGGPGSDVLAGNAGNDTLSGGPGNDALIDGLGSDTLFGGPGDDLFFATQPQLLGGSRHRHRPFRRRPRLRYLAVRLDPRYSP